MLKALLQILVASFLGVAAVYALLNAGPDHEVEFSVTGKCKKVEYRGQIVPEGCDLVANKKIITYSKIHGF